MHKNIEFALNKDINIFLQYIVYFVNPNMQMLTFNVVLGYQGLLFRDNLVPRAFPLKNGWKSPGDEVDSETSSDFVF